MHRTSFYHQDTELSVPYREALDVWTPVAHELLIDTARTYHNWITDQRLAQQVQDVTGVRTGVVIQKWVEPLLQRVAAEAQERSEPIVTALCVDLAQRVSAAYIAAVVAREGVEPEDPQQHAADQRLLCYRRWATDLPSDKGVAALPPRVQLHRTRTSRPTARAADGDAVCPSCFTVLPKNGVCNYC